MKPSGFFKLCMIVLFSVFWVTNAFSKGLPDEWTEVDPVEYGFEYNGLTPACSNAPGTASDKFTFFVKDGKKKNVVIFFQGGGACWDFNNCVAAPTYTKEQHEVVEMFSDPAQTLGIFNQNNEDNPFKNWAFVYIPYCTGDLFWGASDETYSMDDPQIQQAIDVTIQHRGFVNFQAVLTYLLKNMHKPNKIFVTGCSAGSYGATMAFPYIREAFPKSEAYLLGDAGNGVMGGTFLEEGIYNWNVQMPEWIFPDGFHPGITMKEIYKKIAAEYPSSPIAQYTTAFDSVQIFFLNVMRNIDNPDVWSDPEELGISAAIWHPTMLQYVYGTALASPNYRFYIAGGTDHAILSSPKFYEEESAGGVPFFKWVARMIRSPKNKRKWTNQECEVCLP